MELLTIANKLMDSHIVLVYMPALIFIGWLLKRHSRLPNDMIDTALYILSFAGCLAYAIIRKDYIGLIGFAEILLYAFGQGFLLSAVSTHIYGIFHGFQKIQKPISKEGQKVKKIFLLLTGVFLLLMFGIILQYPYESIWALLDTLTIVMSSLIVYMVMSDIYRKIRDDRDALIWQYWTGVVLTVLSVMLFIRMSLAQTPLTLKCWAVGDIVCIGVCIWWWLKPYKVAMKPPQQEQTEIKDTEDNYPYDAVTTGGTDAEEEN